MSASVRRLEGAVWRAVRVLAVAAAVVLVGVLGAVEARAAGDPYTYTVRLWAGNEGTVDGGEMGSITVEYGKTITLSKEFDAVSTNDKYYVKGYRVSGTDNMDGLVDAVTVNEDMDFVVAYGVKGDMVSYTLHFVEQGTGRVLANPITRHGRRGDKPVAAYEYVSGYRPLYRNITGTLGPEGTNDWTFEYVKLAEGETEDGGTIVTNTGTTTTTTTTTGTPTTTTTTGGETTTETGTESGDQGTEGTEQGDQGTETEDQGEDQQPSTTVVQDDSDVNPPQTEEILDIDNPMASGDDGTTTAPVTTPTPTPEPEAKGLSTWAKVAIGLVATGAIVGLGLLAWMVVRARRGTDDTLDE